jgi:thiamine pyrophosphate-dependent acetolactate synthase large subunit-like protein
MLAEAYGVRGVRVATAEELERETRAAMAEDRSTLIEMPVGRMSAPRFFPRAGPPAR